MRYDSVHLEAFGLALPEEPENKVTSDELEGRLEELYGRLGLSVGRLELMSGIRTRRFWPRSRPNGASWPRRPGSRPM